MDNDNQTNEDVKSAPYKSVLIIDDDKFDSFISEKIIKTASFAEEIVIKSSGEEGLHYLKSLEGIPEKLPEIIFLDIVMPAMNGFDFLSEFELFSSKVRDYCKVIILTNFPEEEGIKTRIANNAVTKTMFGKPLTVEVLKSI